MGTAYNNQWVLQRIVTKDIKEPRTVREEGARKITARGFDGSGVSSPLSMLPPISGKWPRRRLAAFSYTS
jgi:hypothetical protein